MFSANIKNSRSSHLAVLMIVLGTLIAFASAAAGGYQQSSYQQSSYGGSYSGGGGGYNYSPVKTLVVPTQYESVDAAIASAQNGDTIKIIGDPSRTFCAFTVTKQLNIVGVNNPIIGAVGCNALLQSTEAGIKITPGGSGSVISGLTVNGFNIGVFICGASGSQVAEVTLKDLTIQSCNWVGIKVDCGYKIVITYCKLVTQTGIKIINSKEVTITYCTFSCGKKAITICGCTVVTITYNTITVCRIGIIILGDSNVLIKQNTITASILAIGIACVDTVEISYNKLSAGIITIINLLGTSCNITYNQVYCTSNFNLLFFDIGVGIVTYGVDNLSITYNNVLVLDNAVGILVLGDLSWCGKEAAVVVISYNNIVIRGEIKIVAFGIIAAKVKDFEISYNKVNIVNTSTDNKWPVVTIAILVVFVSGQRNKMIYNDGRYADYGIVIIFCLGQIILSGNLGRNFANGIEWYGQPNDYLRVSSDWFLGTLVSGTAATAAQNPLGSEMGIALTSGVTSRFSPVMGIMTDQALSDSDINSTVKTRFTTFASTAPRVATIQQDS